VHILTFSSRRAQQQLAVTVVAPLAPAPMFVDNPHPAPQSALVSGRRPPYRTLPETTPTTSHLNILNYSQVVQDRWTSDTWAAYTSKYDKQKPKPPALGQWSFLCTETGDVFLSGCQRVTDIRSAIYEICEVLYQHRRDVDKWGQASRDVREYAVNTLETTFAEFRLCDTRGRMDSGGLCNTHWKANQAMRIVYPDWKCKRDSSNFQVLRTFCSVLYSVTNIAMI